MLAGAERLVKCVIEDTKLLGLQPKWAINIQRYVETLHS